MKIVIMISKFFKKLNYKRKRRLVTERVAQRRFDKLSIDCFNAISDNFEVQLLKKTHYTYEYKQVSIMKVYELDTHETYCLLSINQDYIRSEYNDIIFDFFKTKWIEFKDERIDMNLKTL